MFICGNQYQKEKMLLCWSYNLYQNNISNHLHHLNKSLDVYLKNCDNLLILGDLNSELKGNYLNDFSNVNILKALTKNWLALKTQTIPLH